MPNTNKHWKLLVRYIADECSEREAAEIRALISINEEMGQLHDELRQIWESSASAAKKLDSETAWSAMNRRIRQTPEIFSLVDARERFHRQQRRRGGPMALLRMAAVLLVVTLGSILAVQLMPEMTTDHPRADYQVFKTNRGERSTIQLADGSTVTLNTDSRLTVPSDFGEGTRTLQLEGQGYFKVEKQGGTAFTVHTELATIRVTGTEFDVNSYPGTDHVQVVVATGEVSLQSTAAEGDASIVLKPRDVGLVYGAGEKVVRRRVDVQRYLAWREGRLLFDNASFEEVALRLERWYELDVSIEQVPRRMDGLTASFSDEQIDEVLNVISMALNLSYRRDGKEVTFYPARREASLDRPESVN